MTEKRFQISAQMPVLHLPVLHSLNKWYVKVSNAETRQQLGEFYIGLTNGDFSYYYPMYLYELVGKEVCLSCDDEEVPDDLFDGIIQGNLIEEHPQLYPDVYHEKERQQVHFSSRRGWLNDPNGLFFDGELFHLYYQHNPYGPYHGSVNVSWGHAVSRDGVHFKEYHDGIRPRTSLTHIASGSAVVDKNNISGKGYGTVLATYTAHGTRQFKDRNPKIVWSQTLVYSTDGGYSFQPFEHNPIIPVAEGECWRDPKILFMDDGTLCIAVYETYEGQNCVSFYSSRDCIEWKFESRTMDLYECPDLFRLTVVETGESLWVLYGANGMYRVGTFENYRFTQIGESHPLDYGSAIYAGQSWNSYPDETGRYHIAWIHEGFWEEEHPYPVPFSQSMSLACRLTLHIKDDGYLLYRNPVDAVETLRIGEGQGISFVGDDLTLDLPMPGETVLEIQSDKPFRFMVCGNGFTYDPDDRMLNFTSGKQYRLHTADKLTCRIVTDVRSVELFVGDEISASFFVYDPDMKSKLWNIKGNNLQVICRVWQMKSIWK